MISADGTGEGNAGTDCPDDPPLSRFKCAPRSKVKNFKVDYVERSGNARVEQSSFWVQEKAGDDCGQEIAGTKKHHRNADRHHEKAMANAMIPVILAPELNVSKDQQHCPGQNGLC